MPQPQSMLPFNAQASPSSLRNGMRRGDVGLRSSDQHETSPCLIIWIIWNRS